jgi:hypothetical protein
MYARARKCSARDKERQIGIENETRLGNKIRGTLTVTRVNFSKSKASMAYPLIKSEGSWKRRADRSGTLAEFHSAPAPHNRNYTIGCKIRKERTDVKLTAPLTLPS